MSLSPFRALALSALACGAAVSLTGCGAIVNNILGGAPAETSPDGGVDAAPEGGDTSLLPESDDVFTLAVGDCFVESEFNTSFMGDGVSEVPTVDCAQEHDSEVYHIETLPEGAYPGDESVEASATQACETNFETFIGLPYLDSELYYSFLTPTEDGWNTIDDREVVCYIVTNGEMVTGTLAGAAR